MWLIRFCKGSTTGLFLGASGTAALDGAPADASVAITVVSRSLGIATPCFCFGGCKGFATGSTLGTFGVAALIGALLGPSDAMAVASRSLGTAAPCGCFAQQV